MLGFGGGPYPKGYQLAVRYVRLDAIIAIRAAASGFWPYLIDCIYDARRSV
jgi:hypothetical protein